MTRRLRLLIVMVAIGAAACGEADSGRSASTTTVGATYAVSGYAHAGPTCPVILNPPDPACEDRPVVGVLLIVRDASGAEVARAASGEDGAFSLSLAPGTYTIIPQAVEGLMGAATAFEVIVVDGPVADIDVAYDTGIR
jgi:hypothetical protein